jgi:type II secretory pathway component PulF
LVHALGLLSVTGQSDSRPANVRLLHQLAEMYAERVRNRSNWTSGVFAPLSILAVGLVVLIVALALFVPLVSLVSGLT